MEMFDFDCSEKRGKWKQKQVQSWKQTEWGLSETVCPRRTRCGELVASWRSTTRHSNRLLQPEGKRREVWCCLPGIIKMMWWPTLRTQRFWGHCQWWKGEEDVKIVKMQKKGRAEKESNGTRDVSTGVYQNFYDSLATKLSKAVMSKTVVQWEVDKAGISSLGKPPKVWSPVSPGWRGPCHPVSWWGNDPKRALYSSLYRERIWFISECDTMNSLDCLRKM